MEMNLHIVDRALQVVRSALANQVDWGRDRSDGEGRSGGRRSCGLLHQRAEAAEQPHHHAAEVSALPADRDAPQRVSV